MIILKFLWKAPYLEKNPIKNLSELNLILFYAPKEDIRHRFDWRKKS